MQSVKNRRRYNLFFYFAYLYCPMNGISYNTNFFFVVRPPVKGLPLLNLNHGWFVYFITLLCLGFIGITLVHLPFLIKEHKTLKQEKNSNDDTIAE